MGTDVNGDGGLKYLNYQYIEIAEIDGDGGLF